MNLGSIGCALGLLFAVASCSSDGGGGANAGGTGGSAGTGCSSAQSGGTGGGTPLSCPTGKVQCNDSCLGVGEAAAGCKRIADAPASALAVDDALYYASHKAAVGKWDLTTFADMPLAPAVFWHYGIALDATHVYYATVPTDASTLRIEKVPRAGGTAEAVLTDLTVVEGLDHLSFFGGKLHYRDEGTFGPGKLMQVDGATVTPMLAGDDIVDFAVDQTHVYYIVSTGVLATAIRRAPLTDLNAVESVVDDTGSTNERVGLLGEEVYWVAAGALMRAPKSGGLPERVADLATDQASVVYSDASGVYVWRHTKQEDLLLRYRPGTAAPTPFGRFGAAGLEDPVLTGNATHIYIARPYAIFQLAK